MKRYKKPFLVVGAVSSLALASVSGHALVSAASNSGGDRADSLIKKIATKFNLNESDVASVFDEERASHEEEMKTKTEERLSQAVTDGKITEEQKQKIIAKLDEMRSEREADKDSMKDKSSDEREAEMKAKKADLKKWAKDNGIPIQYLHPKDGHKGPRD